MIKLLSYIFTVFMLLTVTSCDQSNQSAHEQKDILQISWPLYRGSERLDGFTSESIPDELELKWTFKTGYEIKSSPVIGNGRVYIGSNDGYLYCLSLADGSLIWKFEAGDDLEAAPLLSGDTLFFGSLSGDFYALNAGTAQILWQFRADGEIYGSANLLSLPGTNKKQILFGSYDNFVYCLDAGSGTLVWKHETDNYINGTPSTDGKWIAFGGCDENLHILDATTGQTQHEVPAGSYVPSSPALHAGIAYLGHYGNQILAIRLGDGQKIWQYDNPNKGGTFFSSPAVNEDYVIIGSRDNFLHCVDRRTGSPVWEFRTRDDIDASPVICGDKVITASDDGNLYILDITNGQQIWSYETGAPMSGSPAVTGGMICQGARDGRVYLFGAKK